MLGCESGEVSQEFTHLRQISQSADKESNTYFMPRQFRGPKEKADECLSDQSQSAHHQASGWEEMILAGQNWFPCGTWHIARDPTKSASRLLVQWS